eukprot:Ihof_evm3s271 gene=Ihof_evmTU3s271
MPSGGLKWDELQRKSRSLEREIESKLVMYSKIGTNINGTSGAPSAETLATDIDQLIEELSQINDDMSDHTQITIGSSPAILHTLQRHREILNDYTNEFRKTRANITAAQDREQLLSSVQQEINDYKNPTNGSADSYYHREQSRLLSSQALASEAINIAMATKEDLTNQRTQFRGISSRIIGLS